MSNAQRIAALINATGEQGQDRTNLVDLLTDVMHYAKATGLDFDDTLISARNHFSAESD
jgi:hypothetical protein